MKRLQLVISVMIVIASAVICGMFIVHSAAVQRDKIDRAVLNHVRYGLFSVAEWKRQIHTILSGEIERLNLTRTTERELRKRLEAMLNTLIDRVYGRLQEENVGSLTGWFRQSLIDELIAPAEIKKGIPQYADALMKELTRAKTRRQVKDLLSRQLERYLGETFDLQDLSKVTAILERTGAPDVEAARAYLDRSISERRDVVRAEAVLLAVLPVILFTWTALAREPLRASRSVLLILSLAILLAAGVTTPMIDMEAKISRMMLVLLGHPVEFDDQVLFFQSKSILEVFRILITHQDVQMKLVGILLITFSITFPVLKLLSLPVHSYDYRGLRAHPVVRFFAVRSGKWSMADVLVVAIFMAYVGFNGVIDSQFSQLRASNPGTELLTTNGTQLQPGYYLFLLYILLAMLFSGVLAGNGTDGETGGCGKGRTETGTARDDVKASTLDLTTSSP